MSVHSKVEPAIEGRALSGMRVLVGRASHQSSALSAGLRELGAEVIEIPFIEIREPQSYLPLDAALLKLSNYHWLILTSVNGVEAFWSRMEALGTGNAALADIDIAAIGPATKRAIEQRGGTVKVVPERYIAESVVESLRDRVRGKRVLLARAKVARDVIPIQLRELGASVDVVEAYETVIPESSRRMIDEVMRDPARRPEVIAFTSSSTVKNFVNLVGVSGVSQVQGIKYVSIGPVTSDTLRSFNLPIEIEAEEYTIPGLIRAIRKLRS